MKNDFARIAKKYKLRLIVLFGSMATGRNHRGSDADVVVVSEKRISLKRELTLRKELFYALGREIDLVIFPSRGATPLLLGQIAREGKCLYGTRSDFIAFKVQAMKRFIDFKPYFALQAQTVKRVLASR